MRGFSAKNPVPARLLRRGLVVMDMVYNPVRTPLLAAAEKAGAITISGLEMFIRQGMGSFRTWTKKTLPIAEVRKVLAGSGMLGTT
jgi:shikimate dehydrogenase